MALVTLSTAVVSIACAATPWPHPARFEGGDGLLSVASTFKLQVTNPVGAHKHLHSTAERYSDSIVTARGDGCNTSTTGAAQLTKCTVTVKDTSVPLASGVREDYDLLVSADGECSISADTVWGAFHGMESLAQLAAENCTISNAPVRIRDTPRFGFRGLMIDTARHFMPVKFLEHIIEGMAANRLNVLHWHIVDSQAFPYCSEKFPGLCEKGAYSARATYTAEQLSSLVDFAEARGVRIMPEFDMPGHGDWEQGEPEIMVSDGPCDNTMNPTKDATYSFLAKFLREVTTIFPDEYLFLGGDEVNPSCWSGSPSVAKWMKEHDMNATGLGRYFWQQVTAQVLPGLNRTLGVWEDDKPQPHPDDLPKKAFGNIWQAQSTIKSAVDRQFNAVLSGPWYLDQQKPGGCSTYSLQGMWECFYDVEPLKGLDDTQSQYVLGGQACQWSEGINQHNFDARTWTNAAAVAERLWSPRNMTDSKAASPRLIEHVCRMNARGLDANPIEPSFCPMADFYYDH